MVLNLLVQQTVVVQIILVQTFIYLAFAADGSTATPSLANSFATELYTGNGGTQAITGTGFKPDLSWIKNRNTSVNNHNLADSIRGANNIICSNLTNADNTLTAHTNSTHLTQMELLLLMMQLEIMDSMVTMKHTSLGTGKLEEVHLL